MKVATDYIDDDRDVITEQGHTTVRYCPVCEMGSHATDGQCPVCGYKSDRFTELHKIKETL